MLIGNKFAYEFFEFVRTGMNKRTYLQDCKGRTYKVTIERRKKYATNTSTDTKLKQS